MKDSNLRCVKQTRLATARDQPLCQRSSPAERQAVVEPGVEPEVRRASPDLQSGASPRRRLHHYLPGHCVPHQSLSVFENGAIGGNPNLYAAPTKSSTSCLLLHKLHGRSYGLLLPLQRGHVTTRASPPCLQRPLWIVLKHPLPIPPAIFSSERRHRRQAEMIRDCNRLLHPPTRAAQITRMRRTILRRPSLTTRACCHSVPGG